MTVEIKMPPLHSASDAGVVKWLVREGDWVAAGDLLGEIETGTAIIDLEAAEEGLIASLKVASGARARTGSTIALLADKSSIERHIRVEPNRGAQPDQGWPKVLRSRSPNRGVEISVVNGDILARTGDVLLLKHANGFHGVDANVAQRCGFEGGLAKGEHRFVRSRGIASPDVLFMGVGALPGFRYEGIKRFAAQALELLASREMDVPVLLTPVHGAGYGLDEKEAFLSLISGFAEAIEAGLFPASLRAVEVVELDQARAARLSRFLVELFPEDRGAGAFATNSDWEPPVGESRAEESLASFGAASEAKPKLFVAMPFADDFDDVWKIGIQEGCSRAGILCERIDEKAFVGSIADEIRRSLENCRGIIGVLDGANPNVFLEIGFAWALGKPTILVARSADGLPFDIRDQKCILYGKSVHRLREELGKELAMLKSSGVIS